MRKALNKVNCACWNGQSYYQQTGVTMTERPSLTQGPVGPMLIRLTLPMVLGIASMTVFNLVDTFFIAKLGTQQLAAVSFTFPVVLILNSIAQGIGMGTSAVISRLVGEGKKEAVRTLTVHSLLLGITVTAVVILLGELTISPLFHLLGAREEVLYYIKTYMKIWYLGIPFVVIPMIGNNIIRAHGDMKIPGLIMTASAIMNCILDPILIFGVGPMKAFGIAGAAGATVISRSISMCASLLILTYRERLIDFHKLKPSLLIQSWKAILHIAIPATINKITLPFAMGFVTHLIAKHGAVHVAGFGVATKLETFIMLLILALSSVLIPFTGQNAGAGMFNRVRSALMYSYVFSFFWALIIFIWFLVFGKETIGLFNPAKDIVATALLYILTVALSFCPGWMLLMNTAVLNALKKPLLSLKLSMGQILLIYIPFAYVLNGLMGIRGIFLACVAANIAGGSISTLIIYRHLKRLG